MLAHLLSQVVPWVSGLCVLNVAILSTHFIAVGFFHPETPRFLFAIKDRKADCANSLQWLRGKMEDIGQEYTELADAVMLNGGAPVKTPLLQLIEDRSVSLFFKASLKLLFRLFFMKLQLYLCIKMQ